MAKGLGISIYMENATIEENISYINLASKYGFKRIFTCLISTEGKSIEETVTQFKQITAEANKHGMEIIAEIDNTVFERHGVSIHDLSFFKELGLKA